MSTIQLCFSGFCPLSFRPLPKIVLTMEGKDKKVDFVSDDKLFIIENGSDAAEILPKRIMKAFTEHAVEKIFAKDDIPNESGYIMCDGYSYNISISINGTTKEYQADDASIETYSLLRYLASFYRGL